MDFYDFTVRRTGGKTLETSSLKGKVVLIVNTASKCGFTPQFAGLEELHKKYADRGLVILGFPCGQFADQELKTSEEIHSFCQRNYGVTFEMLEKIDVNGKNADPLFVYLRKKTRGLLGDSVKWNFTKFLIDRQGTVVKRFAPATPPSSMTASIESLLSNG